MKRPISLGLAPNLEKKDALSALSYLFQPWKYLHGSSTTKLSEWFKKYYDVPYAYSFSSARGGMYALFKALGLKSSDEVIIQAFTCKAVVEPILAAGLTPIYADINKNFTFSEDDLLKKITPRTKVVVFQHTFGIPNINIDLIKKLQSKNIFIIEDLAHGIGIVGKGEKLGTFGDAAVFSFGRDKAFSSVSGGMVITKNEKIGNALGEFYKNKPFPSLFWTFQQLFHSVCFYLLILPLYDTAKIGKIFLVLF
ncbi:MAG TPA: DegT/DnrJ/EryC1/StrS family aminotransferase, partial [Candidatus Saccharimonadales bacterium]|nr:DegT/DnrJ/EryC1/StrS family aminotransferase [Candidatus Saccharimonadales bacterium]